MSASPFVFNRRSRLDLPEIARENIRFFWDLRRHNGERDVVKSNVLWLRRLREAGK